MGCKSNVHRLVVIKQVSGTPEHYISLSTGYPYPDKDIEVIKAKLASMGIDLLDLLGQVKMHESQPVGEYHKLPVHIEQAMDKVANLEEMSLLKIVHSMFENWAVTIYRGGKIPACGLFCVPTEVGTICFSQNTFSLAK